MVGELPEDIKATLSILDSQIPPPPAKLKTTRTMEDIALPTKRQPTGGDDVSQTLAILDGKEPEPVATAGEPDPRDIEVDVLKLALRKGINSNTALAAHRQSVARKLNISPALVTPQAEESAFYQDHDPEDLHKNYPALAKYLKVEGNAELVGKNIEPMKEMEVFFRRAVQDPEIVAAKGVVGAAQTLVGLGNLVSAGKAGKYVEEHGIDLKKIQSVLNDLYTPEAQAALKSVEEAEGFSGTLTAALKNPSSIGLFVGESLPQMYLGRVFGSGLKAAFPGLSFGAAGAAGEGITMAGGSAEQIRSATEDGELTAGQAALSVGVGVAGTALSAFGAKLATKLGIEDVDAALVAGKLLSRLEDSGVPKQLAVRLVGGAAIEGAVEEMPQSVVEQIAQNVALGRAWDEGVPESAALGLVTGGAMGAAVQVGAVRGKQPTVTETPAEKQARTTVQNSILKTAAAVNAEEQRNAIREWGQRVASNSPLRKEAPDSFKEFVRTMAEEDGALKEVYVDGKLLRESLAQAGIDEDKLKTTMPEVAESLGEALATNGEARIPIEDYAAHIVGTPVEQAILDHLRTTPEGMTYAEAQVYFQEQQDDFIKQAEALVSLNEPVLSRKEFEAQAPEGVKYKDYLAAHKNKVEVFAKDLETVHDRLLEGLDSTGRFPKSITRVYAIPFREFYATNAARMGMLPSELYASLPLNFEQMSAGDVLNQAPEYKGHLVNSGGLQGHSVGELYPYVLVGRQKGYQLLNGTTGERYPVREDAASAINDRPVGKAELKDFNQKNVKGVMRKTGWMIMSAWNPNNTVQSREANDAAHEKLLAELKALGLEHEVVMGRYGSDEEESPSVLILGADYKTQLRLARDYQQESVLVNRGLLYQDGSINPPDSAVQVFKSGEKALKKTGAYTRVPSTGTIFSMSFDFSGKNNYTPEVTRSYYQAKVAQPDSLTLTGVHYSKEQRSRLEGKYFGTGLPGAERDRLSAATDKRILNRVDFYADIGDGVVPESGLGNIRHEVPLSNIYDASKNERGFRVPSTWTGMNDFESQVIDAGYDGYFVEQRIGNKKQGRVVVLGDAAESIPIEAGTLAQSAFYSALQREIPSISKIADKNGMVKADQALSWVEARQKEGKFKLEEVEAVGLKDWLQATEGKVPVADIENFVRENGVQVEEKLLGGVALPVAVQEYEDQPEIYSLYRADDPEGISYGSLGQIILTGKGEYEINVPEITGKIHYPTLQEALERVSRGAKVFSETKFEQYKLPGGENYRELLLTLPKTEGQDFKSAHYDEKNILAHVRFDDRTNPTNGQILFIEEIQSDWAQEGRKKGFKKPSLTLEESKAKQEDVFNRFDRGEITEEQRNAELLALSAARDESFNRTPAAPFVQNTKSWVTLAVKRILRYAAENGYSKIAWTNGAQQVARYDLSKQISEIRYSNGYLKAYDLDNELVLNKASVTEEELPDIIGKEAAQKLLEQPKEGEGKMQVLSGLDLKVGGEGMVAFYDKLLPQVVNDVAKKLGGGKVAEVDFAETFEQYLARRRLFINPTDGRVYTSKDFDPRTRTVGTLDQIRKRFEADNTIDEGAPEVQPSLDITPEMREKILSGLPLFQGNRAGFDPSTFTISLLKGADLSSVIHEGAHFYLEALADLAGRDNAPQQIKDDFRTTLNWFGITGDEEETPGGDLLEQKAFHGSPHDHDKFDSSKIGTGEGAQAYGYGHYFADSREVAEHYKRELATNNNDIHKKIALDRGINETLADALANYYSYVSKDYNDFVSGIKRSEKTSKNIDRIRNLFYPSINSGLAESVWNEFKKVGKLYEVELAPEQDEYLLWDKPLSEQSEKVKSALGDLTGTKVSPDGLDMGGGSVIRDNRNGKIKPESSAPWLLVSGDSKFDLTQKDVDRMLADNKEKSTGENIYSRLTSLKGSQKAASEYLRSLGIRGIKYLDGSSRAKGEGAYNYVIFDDEDIEIINKYAQSARLPETINIDGIERPTTNSEGKPIYPTEEGIRNFWKWFGNSDAKVRKNPTLNGRPSVMYHTTKGDFNTFEVGRKGTNSNTFGSWETFRSGIFVAPEVTDSELYGMVGPDSGYVTGANVLPVYVRAEKPLDLFGGLSETDATLLEEAGLSPSFLHSRQFGHWEMFDDEQGQDTVAAIKRAGYDSVIYSDENPDTGEPFESWVVFSPDQIKSAIGNNGDFSNDPNILKQGGASPSVIVDSALLSVAEEDTAKTTGLFKSDLENDQNGVIPGRLTNINAALKRGNYSIEDIAKNWNRTRDYLRAQYGDTVTLYRVNPPESERNPDTQVVYMGDESLAKRFETTTQKAEAYQVPVSDIVALNARPSGYYEFVVKKPVEVQLPPGRTPEEIWNSMTLDQKRPYHEQWAQSYERYTMEGKAPTVEMQSVFSRFREWMLSVYKSMKDFLAQNPLAGKLNDDIRAVFDRLIASEDKIYQAEEARGYSALFGSAEEAGLSEKEFEDYQTLGKLASARAVDEMNARSIRDMRWLSNAKDKTIKRLQAEAKIKRAAVMSQVTDEVDSMPLNRARNFLTKGEFIDEQGVRRESETKFKLNSAEVKALSNGQIPDAVKGMASDDGVGLELAAKLLGYQNPEALLNDLVNGENRDVTIQGLTDQRMLEQYGDLIDDKAIERAAEKAIHNEARAKFMATGLKILAKTELSATQLNRAAKLAAEATIAKKKIRALTPGQFTRAEAKANREAIESVAKDPRKAIEAQRAALLNNRLAKAALEASEEVDSILKYFKKFESQGVRKAIGTDQIDQIDDLLQTVDRDKSLPLREIDKRQALAEWVAEQEADGFEPVLDPILAEQIKAKHYKEMTVDELRMLRDTVKQIEHVGRLKQTLLTEMRRADFRERVEEAEASIRDNANRTVKERGTPTDVASLTGQWVRQMIASHRKFSSYMREMDGGKDGGVMWRLLSKNMNAAGDREIEMRRASGEAIAELFKGFKQEKAPLNLYAKRTQIPGTEIFMTQEQRIMFGMNWGNEGNRQRLLDGGITGKRALSITEAQAILDTLTKEEWDFIQGVWDHIATYKDQIAALERKLTGIEPEWIEPAEIKTKYGTYRGGYFPAKYDVELSSRSESLEAAVDLRMGMKGAFNTAATRNGYTKARSEAVMNRPLLLSYNVIANHISEVTHRLAWQPWLIDANRILKALDAPIREHYGAEVLRELRNTVIDIAAGDIGARTPMERAINHLRTGSTIVGMGWRFSTAFLQPSGLAQSWARIGGRWMAKGIAESLKNPNKAGEFVNARSSLMKNRDITMNREVREVLDRIRTTESVNAVTGSYFSLIAKMQRMVDIPTWMGAYEKALHNLKYEDAADAEQRARIENDAVALADQAVVDSQSGGQIKDLASIQRGHPGLKLFTNFYSYFSATYNLNIEALRRTNFRSPTDVAFLASDLVLLNVLPVIFAVALKEMTKGKCGDDLECLAASYGYEQMGFMFGQMVLLRDAGSAALVAAGGDQFGYSGPAGLRFFSDLYKAGVQANQGELDWPLFKSVSNTAGVLLHFPTGQINTTLEGIIAVENGDVDGVSILPALLFGTPKE